MNYQNKQIQQTEISITYSNLTVIAMYQTSIKSKQAWMWNMTSNDYKYSISTYWDKNYQPLTIDKTKDNYTGRYRLGLNNFFVFKSNPF